MDADERRSFLSFLSAFIGVHRRFRSASLRPHVPASPPRAALTPALSQGERGTASPQASAPATQYSVLSTQHSLRPQPPTRALAVLLALLFATGLAQAPGRALLAVYVESVLRQPPLLTSTLLAVQMACGGVFALAGGVVSDLVSRRVAVLVGLTTGLFGTALLLAQAPAVLLGLAVFWGLASGFSSTGGQSYLMAAVTRARLGTATAVYFISSTASQAVGAFIAGKGADAAGFTPVALGALGIGGLAVAAGAVWLPSEEARGKRQGTREGRGDAETQGRSDAGTAKSPSLWEKVKVRVASLAHKERGVTSPQPPTPNAQRPTPNAPNAQRPTPNAQPPAPSLGGYGQLLRRPEVLALGALRYLPTTAWGIASLAFPLLIFRASGAAGTVGLFGMISLLAASGAQLATGRAVDRLAHKGAASPGSARPLVPPLTAAILVAALGAALLGSTLTGLFVLGTLWAMAAWALSTTMPPLIHELGAGHDDGRLVAFTHLLWSAGMFTGTLAAGALVEVHYALPFLLAAACLAAALAVAVWFARELPAPLQAPA